MRLVELVNVDFKIDNKPILENISLHLERGKITTLVGVNGGGKTSIARLIIDAIKPNKGQVIRHKNINFGYMPQKIYIDNNLPLNVENFIKLTNPQKYLPPSKPFAKFASLFGIDRGLEGNNDLNGGFSDDFYSWCRRLKVIDILKRQVCELSGGQLQKILFLQAICSENDVLILDEPTQFMDFAAINQFYKIIDEVRNKTNCAILLISHDLHLVMQKTDMIFCVNRHLCCHGKPEDINQHPEFLSLIEHGQNEINLRNENLELAFYSHRHNHSH